MRLLEGAVSSTFGGAAAEADRNSAAASPAERRSPLSPRSLRSGTMLTGVLFEDIIWTSSARASRTPSSSAPSLREKKTEASPVRSSTLTDGGGTGGGRTPEKNARGESEASSRWQSASTVSQAWSTARRTAEAGGWEAEGGGGGGGGGAGSHAVVVVAAAARARNAAASRGKAAASRGVAADASDGAAAAETPQEYDPEVPAESERAAERARATRERRCIVATRKDGKQRDF